MATERSFERILTQVRMRQLVLLTTVAECGTVSKAAEQLHMSQPAVSKTLHELEDLLGEPLFERTVKGVKPTAAGRCFIPFAQSVLAEMRRAASNLTALREGSGGDLRIGSYMVALPQLLPRALSHFLDRDADARVVVTDGRREQLLTGLIAGELDLVVGRMSDQGDGQPIRQTPLYFEASVLVTGTRNPLACRKAIVPADLADQEWIVPHATSVARAPLDLFFQRENLVPRRVIETVSFPFIRALLMQRDIVAALPLQVVQADIQQGSLVRLPVDIAYPAQPVGISVNTSLTLSRSATVMIECLHQAARELYHTKP